ncbi:MAG: hypothetical protein JNL67_03275 [Planctomycetaceae bacterium]|nr:hypothetical protein [Planctomycetaceae bacterium]
MKYRKRGPARSSAANGEFDDEDRKFLISQRQGRRPSRPRDVDRRKAKQLCRQVATTLDLVLSGECHDADLHSLRVVCVEAAPDSSRLCVTVVPEVAAHEFDLKRIESRLATQAGRLRAEVAAAIHRKRAPTLVFHVCPPMNIDPAHSISPDCQV